MATTETSKYGYKHTTDLAKPQVSIHSSSLPLELRLALPSDAEALLRVFSEPSNIEHDSSAAGLSTLPAIEEMIQRWNTLADPLTRLNFVVVASGDVVGVGGMGYIYTREDGMRIGDAGIMINPEARGKGYAYESMRMTIDHAFRVLNLDEVTVEMKEANVAMRGLMEKRFEMKPVVSRAQGDPKFGNEYSYRVKREEWLDGMQSK